MTQTFRPLDVARIAEQSRHLSLCPDIRYLPVTDSTNRLARDLGSTEWRTGTVLVTDHQEAGRGRQGRSWVAPAGTSLLLSFLVDLPAPAAPPEGLMMMALAAADAVADTTGLAAVIKWPNDLLIAGRKVCGILAEYAPQGARRRLILGLGMNVNFTPDAALGDATSLAVEAGHEIDRENLAIALFKHLDLWYCSLSESPDAVFAAWASRLQSIGQPVTVMEAGRTWEGTAIGVQRDGGLQIRTPNGALHTVYAADVSVRSVGDLTAG